MYLSRMFYINCVSKVKQSHERTNILGDSEDEKSEHHLRRAISTRLSWKRKQFILQESLIYFNTSGESRARQQLTNHVAELPRDDIFFFFSPSLSLSLTPLFSIPRGAARSADSIQTNNAVRPLPNVHQPPSPPPHQTTTSSSSYSSPHKHTRQTSPSDASTVLYISFCHTLFLTALMCYDTPRVGIFC